MQNEEDELLHKLSGIGAWVIQTLTFGIDFTYFVQNLIHFSASVVLHASNIFSGSPWRPQFEPLGYSLLTATVGTIEGNHQVLEVAEEKWN